MTANAREVNDALQAAFAAGDRETMRSLFADDCKIREAPSLPFGGTFTGPDGFEAMIAKLTSCFDLEPKLLNVFEVDDSLVITYSHMRLTSRTSGRTVDMPVLEMIRTENGQLVEACPFYWDTHALADSD